jgi:hypothetical protein
MSSRREPMTGRDWTALVLAIGLVTAINAVTIGVLYDAIISSESGLSENATQILTTAFGGIVGVVGAYLGFRAGVASQLEAEDVAAAERPPDEGDDESLPGH